MHIFGSLGTTFPFKDLSPEIRGATLSEGGKYLTISFDVSDNVICSGERAYFEFMFNAPFLHSSSPLLCTTDYTRTTHEYFPKVCQYSRATDVQIVKNGVNIRFQSTSPDGLKHFFQDSYPSWFLFAYAPFSATLVSAQPQRVASLLESIEKDPLSDEVESTGDISMINLYAQHEQRPMSRFPVGHPENILGHEHLEEPRSYNYEDLFTDINLLRQLILDLSVNPGFALVYNVKQPDAYDRESVSKETYYFMHKLFGKPNQHPVRDSQVYHMEKRIEEKGKAKSVSQDYDLDYALGMHTDSVLYSSSHAFFQVNYQTVADVKTCLTDGFACADYMKKKYPEYYRVLCTVPVTYGIRHQFYKMDGEQSDSKRNMEDIRAKLDDDDFFEFELVSSKPVISEYEGVRRIQDENGNVHLEKKTIPIQICHSSSKVGVSAIQKDDFDLYMKATEKWFEIIGGLEKGIKGAHYPDLEWPQDTMLIFNNHRMLHGRAKVINEGLQKFVYREANVKSDKREKDSSNTNIRVSNENGIERAKGISRQMIGAHQHRVNTDNQLRFLEMKILEDKMKDVDLEVCSEFEEVKNSWAKRKGRNLVASWLPRCPSKVLERLIL